MLRHRRLVALLLATPLALAACTGGGDNGRGGSGDPAPSETESNAEPTSSLPEMGETISIDKADLTLDDLRTYDGGNTPLVCADATYDVHAGEEPLQVRGLAAWKLYDPSQRPRTQTVAEGIEQVLDDVAPGTTESGTVCFDAPGDTGLYRISFQENFEAGTDRPQWQGTL